MNYQLENNDLKITLCDQGAELTSVKSKGGLDYLWCGDKTYWGRHAPVLFPIVGRVLKDKYTYINESGIEEVYDLSQHGFARDSVFKMTYNDSKRLEFILTSNEVTKEKYPFEFELKIAYELEDKGIKIEYEVRNMGQEVMYFGIGGHPAFNCPLLEGESLEDYYIEFEKEELATKLFVTPEVYLSEEAVPYSVKKLPLSFEFFNKGVTILTNLKSEFVTLKSFKNPYSITVGIKDMPFLGIWAPEKGAPFMCIEPWVGHTDYITNSQYLSEKKDMIKLEEGKVFNCHYEIIFN